MYECFANIYLHHVHAWCPGMSEENIRALGAQVRDHGEPP